MSDELKPCPHCGSNDYVAVEGTVSSNNFQVVCNWLFGGCGASSGARRTQAEAIEVWNTRADDAPISERIVPSLKEPTEDTPVLTDSRERLEDDLEKLRKKWKEFDGNYMRIYSYVAYSQIINLLDRQASITEREVGHDLMKAGRMAVEVERERIAELTAECNGLKARVKFLQSQIDASHSGVNLVNNVGVVDSGYRGEVMLPLYNAGHDLVTVARGVRCAQMIVMPYAQCEFEEAEELSDTERGDGGFGSSGR